MAARKKTARRRSRGGNGLITGRYQPLRSPPPSHRRLAKKTDDARISRLPLRSPPCRNATAAEIAERLDERISAETIRGKACRPPSDRRPRPTEFPPKPENWPFPRDRDRHAVPSATRPS
jgi:hypothetical protein